jgi:hypothetical protein
MRVGKTPTRKTQRSEPAGVTCINRPTKTAPPSAARLMPFWRTAAIHGLQAFGQVSESKDAPTARSPPMSRAARNAAQI